MTCGVVVVVGACVVVVGSVPLWSDGAERPVRSVRRERA